MKSFTLGDRFGVFATLERPRLCNTIREARKRSSLWRREIIIRNTGCKEWVVQPNKTVSKRST